MNSLKLKGKIKLDDMEFHHIEGGFGEGNKSMLVRDISLIHNQPLGEVNRRINENIKRFKAGIDILDIRANGYEPLGRKLGFTKQVFNQSKNIYLLSERGYSKLLKILEDDFAWEQYEKLVDGYFRMREQMANNQLPSPEHMNTQLELHKQNLNNAVITSNYLIDYIKSAEGYLAEKTIDSFITALQGIQVDIVYLLRKNSKK